MTTAKEWKKWNNAFHLGTIPDYITSDFTHPKKKSKKKNMDEKVQDPLLVEIDEEPLDKDPSTRFHEMHILAQRDNLSDLDMGAIFVVESWTHHGENNLDDVINDYVLPKSKRLSKPAKLLREDKSFRDKIIAIHQNLLPESEQMDVRNRDTTFAYTSIPLLGIRDDLNNDVKRALKILESWTYHGYIHTQRAIDMHEIPSGFSKKKFQRWHATGIKLKEDPKFRSEVSTLYEKYIPEFDKMSKLKFHRYALGLLCRRRNLSKEKTMAVSLFGDITYHGYFKYDWACNKLADNYIKIVKKAGGDLSESGIVKKLKEDYTFREDISDLYFRMIDEADMLGNRFSIVDWNCTLKWTDIIYKGIQEETEVKHMEDWHYKDALKIANQVEILAAWTFKGYFDPWTAIRINDPNESCYVAGRKETAMALHKSKYSQEKAVMWYTRLKDCIKWRK